MSAIAALKDPGVELSVAWRAAGKLLGDVTCWEPETLRLELGRRGVPPTDALMAKLLAAQTVACGNAWTYDHDVLFAFALACDGVAPTPGGVHHPTPEQLCWAARELAALTGCRLDDDEGVDPDAVDPAVAVVLHDDGYVLAPRELAFAQDALDGLDHHGHVEALRAAARDAWEPLQGLAVAALARRAAALPEDAAGLQVRRLADCRRYVAEREERRARQRALLDG